MRHHLFFLPSLIQLHLLCCIWINLARVNLDRLLLASENSVFVYCSLINEIWKLPAHNPCPVCPLLHYPIIMSWHPLTKLNPQCNIMNYGTWKRLDGVDWPKFSFNACCRSNCCVHCLNSHMIWPQSEACALFGELDVARMCVCVCGPGGPIQTVCLTFNMSLLLISLRSPRWYRKRSSHIVPQCRQIAYNNR